MIFELNYDNQEKELMEGRRRYREQLATAYAAGEIHTKRELQPIIDEQNAIIAELDATIANHQARITELQNTKLENTK